MILFRSLRKCFFVHQAFVYQFVGIFQERTELICVDSSDYLAVFYHLISALITAVCSGNSPGICHVHDLGAPVTLGRLKRNLIRSISIAIRILVAESFHYLIKFINICRYLHTYIIQPFLIDEHDSFRIILKAGLRSGKQGTDRTVRPGYNIQTVAEFFIIGYHMGSVGFQEIILGQIQERIHIVGDLSLTDQSKKSIRKVRSQHDVCLIPCLSC